MELLIACFYRKYKRSLWNSNVWKRPMQMPPELPHLTKQVLCGMVLWFFISSVLISLNGGTCRYWNHSTTKKCQAMCVYSRKMPIFWSITREEKQFILWIATSNMQNMCFHFVSIKIERTWLCWFVSMHHIGSMYHIFDTDAIFYEPCNFSNKKTTKWNELSVKFVHENSCTSGKENCNVLQGLTSAERKLVIKLHFLYIFSQLKITAKKKQ